MGKAIYNPVGKAGEYARWACNFYVGCSNDCDYCYCKKGALGSVAGGKEPRLKACFKDTDHAFDVFRKEMYKNAGRIRKEGGLFFSFTSDPLLPQTEKLTAMCVVYATSLGIPCQVLTKCTAWADNVPVLYNTFLSMKELVSVGFTLTGMDGMETGLTVGSNAQRVALMRRLHDDGVKTFASVEPVIGIPEALGAIRDAIDGCDLLKIGLLSGKRDYDMGEMERFIDEVCQLCVDHAVPVYWKKSVTELIGRNVSCAQCVGADYVMAQY